MNANERQASARICSSSAGCSDGTNRRTRMGGSVHKQRRAGTPQRCVWGRSVIREFTPRCTITCFQKNRLLERREGGWLLFKALFAERKWLLLFLKNPRQKWGPLEKMSRGKRTVGNDRQETEWDRTCWWRKERKRWDENQRGKDNDEIGGRGGGGFAVCLELGVRLRVNSREESVVVALWSCLVGNISGEQLSWSFVCVVDREKKRERERESEREGGREGERHTSPWILAGEQNFKGGQQQTSPWDFGSYWPDEIMWLLQISQLLPLDPPTRPKLVPDWDLLPV